MKYWAIQRDIDYYAVWRNDNGSGPHLTTSEHYRQQIWRISEFHPLHDDLPPTPDNCGEAYTWAHTPALDSARVIAQAFAAQHGGTVVEFDGILMGAADPHAYNPADWQ